MNYKDFLLIQDTLPKIQQSDVKILWHDCTARHARDGYCLYNDKLHYFDQVRQSEEILLISVSLPEEEQEVYRYQDISIKYLGSRNDYRGGQYYPPIVKGFGPLWERFKTEVGDSLDMTHQDNPPIGYFVLPNMEILDMNG